MKTKLFSYTSDSTIVHSLSGATKLICFLLLTSIVMYSYDIRFMIGVGIFSIWVFVLSKTSFKKVRLFFIYLFVFILFNNIIGFFFAPTYGCDLYGSCSEIFHITSRLIITKEELFYQLSKMVKYLCIIPLGVIFFLTTHPSEFASSLNKAKIPYQGAFSVSLALRYFPDIARQFTDISQAQQARGIDMSKKEKLMTRLKNALLVVSPLIFSTLDRVDYISNAMDLRGFGKHKTRTWYVSKKMTKNDYIAIFVCLCIVAIGLYMGIVNGSRFYNPFK